ncbi:GpE family phage tail protein [Altericroceibacterium endophyticum]|uniref:GpE family phage tail protein n=1 Tax=Altericroceibacterium endophyticum TaxID=1808508 RepID=A0A6I4T124_9SPHN|nr:GpE family phage tail protein [Altericroceibacterium endophyticum]MXO64864.1 GpE family phage tail protein [Altericroceibacterium endophyticum]
MANIALAFHWSLESMGTLSLAELGDWERRAIDKLELLHRDPR